MKELKRGKAIECASGVSFSWRLVELALSPLDDADRLVMVSAPGFAGEHSLRVNDFHRRFAGIEEE